MSITVPFVDLRAQARELHDELLEVFESVTSRAAYTLGPEGAAFEAAFAEYGGVRFCAGVSSGTDAVRLALQAAGVGPGDEVVVPVNTFIATAEAVSHCGATPVFADVRPDIGTIDVGAAAALVNERTVGIIAVDVVGQPADYDELKENRDELADELKTCDSIRTGKAAKEMAALKEHLKIVTRRRDELMASMAECRKQCKWWEGQAKKLGWKPAKK